MSNKVSNLTSALSRLKTNDDFAAQDNDSNSKSCQQHTAQHSESLAAENCVTQTKPVVASSSTSIVDLPADVVVSQSIKNNCTSSASVIPTYNQTPLPSFGSAIPTYNQTPLPSFTNLFNVKNGKDGSFGPNNNKPASQNGSFSSSNNDKSAPQDGFRSGINLLKQIMNDNNVRESQASDSSLFNELLNDKDDLTFFPAHPEVSDLAEKVEYSQLNGSNTRTKGTATEDYSDNDIFHLDGFIDYELLLIEKEKNDQILLRGSSYTSVDYEMGNFNHKVNTAKTNTPDSNSIDENFGNDLELTDTLTSLPIVPAYQNDDTDNDSAVITYKRTVLKQDSLSSFSTLNAGNIKNPRTKSSRSSKNNSKIQKPIGKSVNSNSKIINVSIYSGSETDVSKPMPAKLDRKDSLINEIPSEVRNSTGAINLETVESNHIIVDFPKPQSSALVTTESLSSALHTKLNAVNISDNFATDNNRYLMNNNTKLADNFLKAKQQQSNSFKRRISSLLRKNGSSFGDAANFSNQSKDTEVLVDRKDFSVNENSYDTGGSSSSLKKMINFIGNSSASVNNINNKQMFKNSISLPLGLDPKISSTPLEAIDLPNSPESKNIEKKNRFNNSGSSELSDNIKAGLSIGGKVTGAFVNYRDNLKHNYMNNIPSSLKKNKDKSVVPDGMKNLHKVQFAINSNDDGNNDDDDDSLETNLIQFIDKYILPNCDVVHSFVVFSDSLSDGHVANKSRFSTSNHAVEKKKSKSMNRKKKHHKKKRSHNNKSKKSGAVYKNDDKEILMITNSNVPLSRRSTSATSLARKFSLSKKGKPSDNSSQKHTKTSSINKSPNSSEKLPAVPRKTQIAYPDFILTDDLKIKKIFKLETDEFLKLFKFWIFDHILPKSKDIFPYLHNLDYNVSQYVFFNNFYGFNSRSDSDSNNCSPQSSSSFKKEDLIFHMNDLRFNSIENDKNTEKSKRSSSDPQLANLMLNNDTSGTCSNLSKFVPLPNLDKYLLLINTSDEVFNSATTDGNDLLLQDSRYFDGDDIDTTSDNEAGLSLKVLNYLQKCFYLKGSISVDEILEFDDCDNENSGSNHVNSEKKSPGNKDNVDLEFKGTHAKKKTLKVRFEFNYDDNEDDSSLSSSDSFASGNSYDDSSSDSYSYDSSSSLANYQEDYFEDVKHDEYDDAFEGHEYIKFKQMIHNGKRYSNFSQPLNLLKRVNGYSSNIPSKSSKNNEGNLNLYDKKINLRNYAFQSILLFKIANVVIYNNKNDHELNLKFAKIFSLLQKKIYLNEYYKKKNLNFRESLCFILNFEIDKIINFDIIHYNENENVILNKKKNINHNLDGHLVKRSSTYNPGIYTKFETIDTPKKNYFFYHNNSTNLRDLLKNINEGNPFLFLGNNTKKGLKNDLNDWSKNYLLHEKFENWLITSSFKVFKNFYVGNIVDYNNTISLNRNKEKYNKILEQIEKIESDGSGEKADDVTILRKQLLQLQNKITNNDSKSGSEMISYKILINCKEGVQFPTMKVMNKIYEDLDKLLKKETDLIYLEFPSLGSILSNSLSKLDIILAINFLKLLKTLTDKDLSILVYCYDGFTHNSLLLLMFEISNSFINLNNAILKFYKIYERYIYWFKIDFELLKILEPYLLFYSDKNPNGILSLASSGTSILTRPSEAKQPDFDDKGFITNIKINDVKTWYNDVYLSMYSLNSYEFLQILNHNDDSNIIEEHRKLEDKVAVELRAKLEDWFNLQNDNNFPSKILPYLYLGSLAHLNSKTILEILGINYVISIGEKPLWMPETYENKFVCYAKGNKAADSRLGSNDIVEIDNPLPFINKLIYLPNLQDNGIDSFDSYLETLLKIIKKIRKENDAGSIKSKIFINCKAGVSRSASLCISEVMNFLKISLSRAYLYVRVRRLNLIIQPNLKIFYNILSLEEYLTTKENNKIKYYNSKVLEYNTENKKDLKFKKIKPLREIDWHVLCKEIDLLNKHYIK